MDELQARHRKEQRDLQSRITQKKKQTSKKTRKGVNDECDSLEAELKHKQQAEVATLIGDVVNGADADAPSRQFEELALEIDDEGDRPATNGTQRNARQQSDGEDATQSQEKKPNRQKARLARRAADHENMGKQAAEEARNLPDLKQQEHERMLECMKERGLQEKEIKADGHCLYSAVADQLEQLRVPLGAAPEEKPSLSYKVVRSAAADYVEKHQDDVAPFLEEPLPEYVHKIRDTSEWGGQMELMALAKSYCIDINVLQDFGRVEKIESGNGKGTREIWLGYYKHGFGLGEHYNSLRKAP